MLEMCWVCVMNFIEHILLVRIMHFVMHLQNKKYQRRGRINFVINC